MIRTYNRIFWWCPVFSLGKLYPFCPLFGLWKCKKM